MARMSVDDSFLRDPRVVHVARHFGWSVYEARGRLLEVFAICYDREDDVLVARDIDTAADQVGLSDVLVEAGLASRMRGGQKYRIHGARERIEYLHRNKRAAHVGGVKSGESRRRKRSGASSGASGNSEALANPPDPVPDSVPDPVPDPAPDRVPDPSPEPLPRAEPAPGVSAEAAVVDPTPVPPPPPVPNSPVTDPLVRERQRLLREVFPEHVQAYNAMVRELGLGGEVRPMALVGDPAEREFLRLAGERRTLAALAAFADDVRHVLAVRAAEARRKRTVEHFGAALYGAAFTRALAMRPQEPPRADAKPAPTSTANAFAALRDEAARGQGRR